MVNKANPKSVLFVCYLNSVRSPMAQGLMQRRFAQAHIASCGMDTGELDDLMVAVMREKGIDMSAHIGQTLQDVSERDFDYIIAFTETAGEAARAVFEGQGKTIDVWALPDPTEGSLDVRAIMNNYRALRDNIDGRLERHFT